MSKIYEALLRAELERTAGTGSSSADSANTFTVQNILTPSSQVLAAPEEDEDPLGPLYTEDMAEPASSFAAPDFSTAVSHPWLPLPGALPALEERGPQLEQFRSLRSHILEARDTAVLKSVVISSGLPGEGKSFVALNLALSFSRHKSNRVLLIDGDMRRSSLHRALGTSREPGLTDFLSGEKSLAEVMQRCTTSGRTIHPGLASLSFIPGGRDTDNAGDLAASPKFAELIASATAYFDWVFVDSSPANLVSDAVSLARACNGVLLVARDGVTKFKTAQEAQAQFKSVNVLGVVLNAVQKLPAKADYYGTYDSYKREA
jgi:capsular exopolysaccharide synthesis family protein